MGFCILRRELIVEFRFNVKASSVQDVVPSLHRGSRSREFMAHEIHGFGINPSPGFIIQRFIFKHAVTGDSGEDKTTPGPQPFAKLEHHRADLLIGQIKQGEDGEDGVKLLGWNVFGHTSLVEVAVDLLLCDVQHLRRDVDSCHIVPGGCESIEDGPAGATSHIPRPGRTSWARGGPETGR